MSRDLVLYAALTALAKGMQFLLLPILTRLFSPAEYGFVELVATVMGLVTILMSFSIESAVARQWHAAEASGETRPLVSAALGFVTLAGALSLAVLGLASVALATRITGREDAAICLVLAGCATWLSALGALPQMVLRMERKALRFGILSLLQATLGVALAVGLVVGLGLGLPGLFAGNLLAAAIALTVGLAWVRRHLAPMMPRGPLRQCLRYCLPLTPAVAIGWANSQVDRLILLAMLGLAGVGMFGAAAKIAMVVAVLVEAFRLAWLPLAMRRLDDVAGRSFYFRRALTTYLGVMFGVGLIIASYGREVLVALTTVQYAPAHTAIPWLVGAQVLLGAASITNAGTLASGKTGANSIAAAIAAAIGISLSLVLVPRFGLDGAAAGAFLAALTFAAVLPVLSRRSADIRFNAASASLLLAIYVAASAGNLALHRVQSEDSLGSRTAVLFAALAAMGIAAYVSSRRDEGAKQALAAAPPGPAQIG